MVLWVTDPRTVVLRSDVHFDVPMGDTSGPLGTGASGLTNDPFPGTTDSQIGFHPPWYEGNAGIDEVHTMIGTLHMTNDQGWGVRAGEAAPAQPNSFGEVESRALGLTGFPADSFFNIYFEVDTPPDPPFNGMILENREPFVVEEKGITAFPPVDSNYLHSWSIVGRVAVFRKAVPGPDGFVGWLSQGSHGVAGDGCLKDPPPRFPVVFSVGGPVNPAEGLLQPDPLAPFGHPPPNDVYVLGPDAPGGAWVYATEGELFQSSGAALGASPDVTNVDRMSAALGIGPPPGGPPYGGPFAPNPGAPVPTPAPPGAALGTLGLVPGDNIDALSFGLDGGDVLLFSVDPGSVGLAATAVDFQANLSPPVAVPAGGGLPSNGGGDPGDEAAADIYLSPRLAPVGAGAVLFALPAAAAGSNILACDEFELGLQAPAAAFSAGYGPAEDDLDALEADVADTIDSDRDGVPDTNPFYRPVFFSLAPTSATVVASTADPFPGLCTAADPDGVTADDILVAAPPGVAVPPFAFAIYARGVMDIGLLPGDVVDALVLSDNGPLGPDGFLVPGVDVALFSLGAGSPSLAMGANASMPGGPGGGPYSPADVFMTTFAGPGVATIGIHAGAAALGLAATDELDALDIGWGYPCQYCGSDCGHDADADGIPELCDNCPYAHNLDQQDCDGDGVGELCDICPNHYNPGQETRLAGPFPYVVRADSKVNFSWGAFMEVGYVIGDLGAVASYGYYSFTPIGSADSFYDYSVPSVGQGFYYCVREWKGDCDCLNGGSWQTSSGAEPERDVALP